MKRIKAILIILLIIISVFLPNYVLAYSDTVKSKTGDMTINKDDYMNDSENGSSSVGSNGNKRVWYNKRNIQFCYKITRKND